MKHSKPLLATFLAIACAASAAHAQEHEEINAANNPLTPKITVNFHNDFIPSFIDIPKDMQANQFLLRGA